jgi:hypothetical protein
MTYTIELDKYDLARLKRIVKDALQRELKAIDVSIKCKDESGEALADYEATQLMMLMGKLDNVIPVADKITVKEDQYDLSRI